MKLRSWMAALAAVTVSAAGATAAVALPSHSAYTPPPSPCNKGVAAPATYQHVVWFTMENQSASSIYGNPSGKTPFMDALANQCGKATDMHGEFKPSAPNYVAMTSGGNQGLTSDANPTHSMTANNVFNQVATASPAKTWGYFSSRMPTVAQGGGNCWTKDFPGAPKAYYTAHHEAAPYFKDIWSNGTCSKFDVPLHAGETGPLCGAAGSTAGATTVTAARNPANCADTSKGVLAQMLAANTLPNFTMVGPADDGGNGTLGGEVDPTLGDAFLQRWISKIEASPEASTTAIFITWDENGCFTTYCKSHPTSQTIPTIVVAPSIKTGTVSNTAFNHYSMLHTTQQMLGLATNLTTADANATSMRSAFGF